MYHHLEEPECSKCAAKNSEQFTQRHKSGRRCLSCGHEKIESESSYAEPTIMATKFVAQERRTF